MRKLCLALIACVGLITQAHAYRIGDDNGGSIGEYADRYKRVDNSGEPVEIDGICLSACTMVLGIVPRNRICVTKRAVLGFHSATGMGANGRPGPYSYLGTQVLLDTYPYYILQWISENRGLTPRMIYLRGPELAEMYPQCRKKT